MQLTRGHKEIIKQLILDIEAIFRKEKTKAGGAYSPDGFCYNPEWVEQNIAVSNLVSMAAFKILSMESFDYMQATGMHPFWDQNVRYMTLITAMAHCWNVWVREKKSRKLNPERCGTDEEKDAYRKHYVEAFNELFKDYAEFGTIAEGFVEPICAEQGCQLVPRDKSFIPSKEQAARILASDWLTAGEMKDLQDRLQRTDYSDTFKKTPGAVRVGKRILKKRKGKGVEK